MSIRGAIYEPKRDEARILHIKDVAFDWLWAHGWASNNEILAGTAAILGYVPGPDSPRRMINHVKNDMESPWTIDDRPSETHPGAKEYRVVERAKNGQQSMF